MDNHVLEYLLEERANGRPVSNKDLISKAQEKAQAIRGMEDFKGSRGWLRRWKKRNSVAIRKGTNESQKLPRDYAEQCKLFSESIKEKRRTHTYPLSMIGNMDQTQVRFDMAPSRTNEIRGASSVRIATTGGSKKGFTVALAAMANGTKLPAYIVFKEGQKACIPPRVFAALRIPCNVRISATSNGWMTGQKMKEWIDRIWGDDQDDYRRLLVLDQARIHTMQTTREHIETKNSDVVFIPGGCTNICQPADVCWNAIFKRKVREEWVKWRRNERRTPAGNLQMETRQDVINWISSAWDDISEDLIRKSFKSCGISIALNGSEDELLNDQLTSALDAAQASSSDTDDEMGDQSSDSENDSDATEHYFSEQPEDN